MRLDAYLAEAYPDISRSTWQKYIKEGYVQVNGAVVTQVKTMVRDDNTVTTTIPSALDHSAASLPIIYQDSHVLVINKPVGVLTHSKGALNSEFTVADFFKRFSSYHADTNRPGIVHRLDRDTSGVLIGALDDETAHLLQKQFADRKAKKTYLAIVAGRPKNDSAVIDLPIGRNPSKPSTFRINASGKSAVTTYEVLTSNGHESLIKLQPTTGRTHQLRVHLAYIGAPIVGDRVYGKADERLYLHAYSLEVTIPTSDRRTFTAAVPDEFKHKFPDFDWSIL